MKKSVFTKISLLALCASFFISCGAKNTEFYFDEEVPVAMESAKSFAAPKMVSRAASAKMAFADSAVMEEAVMEADFSGNGFNGPNESYNQPLERKIIRNGNVSLSVENLEEVEEKISDWAKKFGGYITNSWASESSANFTVKIPSERFDEAFNESKTYGKFLNGSIYSDDITDQYYDLETRLEAKKILRDRLQGYLKNAKETKELLNIERELNNAVSEIESMEGRLRRMQNQVAFSTITISVQLPFRQTTEGYTWPSWKDGFRHFASNILDYFMGFVKVLCYIIICGTPILALLVFLFWLLFGKVGLIKKLFRKLK